MKAIEATEEAVWVKHLVSELGTDMRSIRICCDSQSNIHLTKYQVYYTRTKNIVVRYHKTQEYIFEREIHLENINTKENASNTLTKLVPIGKLKYFLSLVKDCIALEGV